MRHDGAFPAIIEQDQFDKAQAIIAARSDRLSDDEMLERLRTILDQQLTLSGLIIDEFEGAPSSSSYRTRFGSLLRAYALVGFKPKHDYSYLEVNRLLKTKHPEVLNQILHGLNAAGAHVRIDPETDLIHINDEFTAALVIARSFSSSAGTLRWKLRLDAPSRPDLTIGVRMCAGNESVLDYYLIPRLSMEAALVRLCEHNGLSFDAFQFPTPDRLFRMATRAPFRRAA